MLPERGAKGRRAAVQSLRDRWSALPPKEVMRLLREGRESPFGLTEASLLDYRGCTVGVSLNNSTIEGGDLSFFTVGPAGQIITAAFTDCLFVECRNDSNLQGRMVRCDFGRAELKAAVLMGEFVDCEFTKANLAGVRGFKLTFERCRFLATDLRRASIYDGKFKDCEFVDCQFGFGSLGGSQFEGCNLTRRDVGDTVLDRSNLPA